MLEYALSLTDSITSLAVHMSIQKTYVHFHPPPRGGYDTLLRFLVKCIIVLVIWLGTPLTIPFTIGSYRC